MFDTRRILSKAKLHRATLKLAYNRGVELCADIMTKAFGSRTNATGTNATGQQLGGFLKHRHEVLGHLYFRVQATGNGKMKRIPSNRASLRS